MINTRSKPIHPLSISDKSFINARNLKYIGSTYSTTYGYMDFYLNKYRYTKYIERRSITIYFKDNNDRFDGVTLNRNIEESLKVWSDAQKMIENAVKYFDE